MKKLKKTKRIFQSSQRQKGITLVALIITIVILVILAGISINAVYKLNIINYAINGTYNYAGEGIKENKVLDKTTKLIDSVVDKLSNTLGENKPVESEPEDGKPEKPIKKTVVNKPDTLGFNEANTYYVTWDLNKDETEYVPNELMMQNGTEPSNWYDYTEGVNHWANIKTTGGGNDCYWVWIPRYAYKITSGYHSNVASTIEIKFLQGTSNTPMDGSDITISNSTGSGNWNVHPAFWFDKDNDGEEDEGEQLTGIWVAKFEASSSAVNEVILKNESLTGDIASLSDYGGGQNLNLQVRVKPNVTSWRYINVNGMFDVCQNLTKTVTINGIEILNSLADTTNLDSHMMKNIEWGAVAYLSRSVYGMNDEVWNNPYCKDESKYSPITGLCGNTANAYTNDITKTYRYNEKNGGKASTTGNVYGVYDMAGGAMEYVAGIWIGGASNTNRSKLWDSNNLKYVDKYTKNTDSQSNYYGNTNQYGDAIYETSSFSGKGDFSWDSSNSNFPSSGSPVFFRGGRANIASKAGVFAYHANDGQTGISYSFRPTVISVPPQI